MFQVFGTWIKDLGKLKAKTSFNYMALALWGHRPNKVTLKEFFPLFFSFLSFYSFFLFFHYYLFGVQMRKFQSECRKIRTTKNSAFGHFSPSDKIFYLTICSRLYFEETLLANMKFFHIGAIYKNGCKIYFYFFIKSSFL